MNQNKRIKKLLSLDDLENFYSKYKRSMHFSSKESGYQLAVQIPSVFQNDESMNDDTLFYGKIKAFHIGTNRNHSNVTEQAARKAMKTMAYKPVLANFCEIEDENGNKVKDFTAHDMELDADGNINYIEHQIGCFTADEPWIEHDDELDKDFIYAYVAIPKDYTDAVDIIERKNGTKVSVELLINELSYNAKTKVMDLTDVIVSGICCLGTNPDTGKSVEEGMLGSRLDIKDFSQSNNSIFSELSEDEHTKLIDTLEKLNDTLGKISKFNINEEEVSQKNDGKEDNIQVENINNEEIEVEEVTETEEVEVTETEESTEEEVTETTTETESEETVEDETPEVVEDEACKKKHSEESDEVTETAESENLIETESDENDDDNDDETIIDENEACGGKKKKYSKTFELSFDEKVNALYQLLTSYEEANNDYYYIVKAYNDNFIYQSCFTGAYFGQKYNSDGDNVSFDGDRYELFAEYLTASEKVELESMRSNYSSISEKLSAYELSEELADKKTIFNEDAYSNYLETEEFKSLMSDETMKQFSKDELVEKADAALGKLVKMNKTFALNTEEKPVEKKPSFYAFARQESNSNFLDGLLKK